MKKEIRINPKTPLSDIDDKILTMYNLVVDNKILSNKFPTDMDQVINALRYSFGYCDEDTKMFMEFIQNNDTNDIQWDEPFSGVYSDKIYLRPKLIVGAYSTYPRQV